MSNNDIVYLVVYPNDDYNDTYEIFQNKDDAIQACLKFCEHDGQFYEMYNNNMFDYKNEGIEYKDWLIEGFNPLVDSDDFPKIYERVIY